MFRSEKEGSISFTYYQSSYTYHSLYAMSPLFYKAYPINLSFVPNDHPVDESLKYKLWSLSYLCEFYHTTDHTWLKLIVFLLEVSCRQYVYEIIYICAPAFRGFNKEEWILGLKNLGG